jgi:hypothetical protein
LNSSDGIQKAIASAIHSTDSQPLEHCPGLNPWSGPKPSPVHNITPTLRKAIARWEARHSLARESFLNALDDTVLIKVHQLETAKAIRDRLATQFGANSDLKYSQAEA